MRILYESSVVVYYKRRNVLKSVYLLVNTPPYILKEICPAIVENFSNSSKKRYDVIYLHIPKYQNTLQIRFYDD